MQRVTDIKARLLSPNNSIREAMERLDAHRPPFQLIVDETNTLVGTLTDGDVRRGLLSGLGVDEPVEKIMHRDFFALTSEEAKSYVTYPSALTFVPCLSETGTVETILLPGGNTTIPHALVMAGGYGRRLGEITKTTPKPLIPVGGRPILDWVLLQLEDAKVARITLSVHYLADQLRSFIEQRNNRAKIDFVHENQPLGTAGALGLLDSSHRDPVLVVNGDVRTDCNFSAFSEFHRSSGYDATIAVTRYQTEVPFGVVRFDDDGKYSHIDEKPTFSHYISAGIYLIGPNLIDLIEPNQAIDMPDLIALAKASGLKIGVFPIHEYWIDVGQPKDLARANEDALKK